MATSGALRQIAWQRVVDGELRYLAPGLAASAMIFAAYVATHPTPAYGAGLFLAMAEAVSANGYALPETVRGYTAGGVPFAYPPLGLYALAVVQDATGLEGITLARYLPGLVSTVAVVPTYYLSRAILGSRFQASVATVLAAASPPILQWHLSAGGVVRAPAYVLLLTGLYAGVRLFDDRERRWTPRAATLFGLTVLTHPLYATAFAISYLWLYAALDRTVRGLRDGAVVAAGGLALAAPWAAVVATRHGPETFVEAAGTHGGIGGRFVDLLAGRGTASILFNAPWAGPAPTGGQIALWAGMALVVAALAYTFLARGPLLPGWFVVLGVMLWKGRFGFLLGAMMVVFAAADGLPRLLDRFDGPAPGRVAVSAVVLLAVVVTAVGGLFAAGLAETYPGNPSQPQYADRADVAAMDAVVEATDPDASFLVLGDAAEWFPYLTDRTSLTGHWGVEWHGDEAFGRQYVLHRHLSLCPTAECITRHLRENGLEPDYLYVPTDEYTVNGGVYRPPPDRFAGLVAADRYDLVYRNQGVAVFEVGHDGESRS